MLAQMVLECGLAYTFAEHPAVVSLFKKLNPSYKLPCSKTLSTSYLESTFSKIETLVTKQLKDTQVALVVDQSTDGAGDPIAHVVAVPPSGVPVLLEEVKY